MIQSPPLGERELFIHSPRRYHLQALRHFYALACERRLVVPRDVRTGDPIYAHLRIQYAGNELFDPPNVSLVTRDANQ